ncbi:uncharacterized protein [Oryctolagus cuniculus]|uniref:uncharacterized protein isoform X4 n=1 Tax=Oryctolagus cuniculus TaxID=9986 RepID=UPI003879AA1D
MSRKAHSSPHDLGSRTPAVVNKILTGQDLLLYRILQLEFDLPYMSINIWTQQFSGPTCSVSTLPLSLQCWSLFPVPLIAVGFCDCLDEWNKQKISVSWWKVMRVHLLFCLCTHTQLWEPCPEAVTLQRSREETIQEYREKAKEPQLFNSSQQALSGYERKLSCSELHILAAAFDSPYMNCTMMCKLHGLHFPLCPSTALRPFLFSKSDDENLKNTDPI